MKNRNGFHFALGEWTYSTKVLNADGGYDDWPRGSWKFWNILDSDVHFQDEVEQEMPNGGLLKGTMLRVLNAATNKWDCKGIVAGQNTWDTYEAEALSDSVVKLGNTPTNPGAIERVTFYDFQKDSWKRRLDASYDSGKTWIENLAMVEVSRKQR